MRNLITAIIVVVGGLILAASSFAADVQMTIQPQLISLLDRAVMKIEFIDGKGSAIDIPEVEGLNIQYQGQSSETRIVNFKSSSKIIHNYLITPAKVGDYTIGPVKAKFKGGEKELTGQLRVIKPKDDPEAQQVSEIMFSHISASRKSLHVHEPFDLELRVYIRDGIRIDGNFSIRGGLPENGLDGELQWKIAGRERAETNGTIFNVYTLRTTAKTLTAGTFTFQPQVQLSVVIPRQQRRSWGFDDPFFGDMFGRQETRPFTLECNQMDMVVQAVPMEGRPDSFSGGVGIFDFDVDVGPTAVKAGEPITVKMRIYGKGNLTKITPPLLEENHAFKLYDARTVPSENPNEIRFEQVLIPKSGTVSNIPPISFSYFNTQTADFRSISQGPFPVTVEDVPQQTAQVIATVPSTIQQETKILGRDIIYLKPEPKKWTYAADVVWYRTTLFNFMLALPAMLFLIVAGSVARNNKLENDVAFARRQKAPKAARVYLQRAEQALKKNETSVFYEALWDAMTAYFGHRFNLPPGEVTFQSVSSRIPAEQASVENLFNIIEHRRYGVSGSESDSKDEMKVLLSKTAGTLKKCERSAR